MKEDKFQGIAIHFSDGKRYIWNYLAPLLEIDEFKTIPKIIFLEACRGMMHEFSSEKIAIPAAAGLNRQCKRDRYFARDAALFSSFGGTKSRPAQECCSLLGVY
jgi:hypothetical protein